MKKDGEIQMNHSELKIFNIIRNMPELYHKLPNQKYDSEKSEVLKWLSSPEIIECLFETAKRKGLIKYNNITGKWNGAKDSHISIMAWSDAQAKANKKRAEKAQYELEIAFNRLSLENHAVTVNQIADFLDISSQAVYGRIKKNGSLTAKKGIVIRKR